MELLPFCCSSIACYGGDNLNLKFIDSTLTLRKSKLFLNRRIGIACSMTKPKWNLGISYLEDLKIENSCQKEGIRFLGRAQTHAAARTVAQKCNCYVADGNARLTGVSKKVDENANILIPGLSDESDGNQGSQISSCFWEWKPKLSVHYDKSGSENVTAPSILFLPGFGVGSFHYEKQLKDLGQDYRVWALDFLGQGMSMLCEDPTPPAILNEGSSDQMNMFWGFGEESEPWAQGLVYSVDLWRDQVHHFIEQVIGEPVYIVGNSLGGYVALYFAACSPELVKGVGLLNATPFWGFLPNPIRSPRFSKLFPWSGTFPLPTSVRKLTEIVWQKISDPSSIRDVLKQVYADHSTKVDNVFSRIVETTQHPAAAASFASIIFAPTGQLSFQESLSRCQMQGIPICLVYGKEDPWVRPVWGRKIKRQLPEAPYYEITPAGHCPHDEVSEVVNYLLRGWIKNLESGGSITLPLLDEPDSVQHGVNREVEYIKEGSRKSVQVRFYGSKFSFWNQIASFVKSSFANFRINSH